MNTPTPNTRKKRIGWKLGLGILGLAAILYLSPSLWLGFLLGRMQADLARIRWPFAAANASGQVSQVDSDGSARVMAAWTLAHIPGGAWGIRAEVQGKPFAVVFDDPFRLDVPEDLSYVVREPAFEHARIAWNALFSKPVIPPAYMRWAAAFWLRPKWDGVHHAQGRRFLRIRIPDGKLWGTPGGRLAGGQWEGRIHKQTWRVDISTEDASPEDAPGWLRSQPERRKNEVCGREMDRSIASILGLLALQTQPVPIEPDGDFIEGVGRLRIRRGARILHLAGTPYEMGLQQGILLRESVQRGVDRMVYGVGLMYSVTRGEWFFDTARDIIERQAPFVEDRFFEEIRGISDGSGVSFEEIMIANFFPELWHCSGISLFGEATADGKMLHARVLDYIMVGGLQDEAVLIAASPDGYARFVNIGYSGFVGSVTGMNEHGIAIGEMGGSGPGQWDGTPMSLLIRGALEECASLDQTLAYFQDRPRTFEYYYVFSEGGAQKAAAVRATPKQMEVVFAGETDTEFSDPIPNTAIISRGSRYRNLVRRVREQYGTIEASSLIEILRRPVSMRSNLHNVIFEVDDLVVHIAHAGRHAPACDQPYLRYSWEDLFPSADE